MKLEEGIERICRNIEEYGLERYDVRDIRWLPYLQENKTGQKLLRKMFLGAECFFPIYLRKLLKIEKSLFPTTFTFLANAFLVAEKNNIDLSCKKKSFELMEMCLSNYLREEDGKIWWDGGENKFFYPEKDVEKKTPSLNMHALARCNQSLIDIGDYYHIEKYQEIVYKTVDWILNQHNIFYYDNCANISYYYNSDECTLNINTEFCQLISMLPQEQIKPQYKEVFNGILNLLLEEQEENGSWGYYSKRHIEKYKIENTIDCHHTATVLYNLIYVSCSQIIEDLKREKLIKAIESGMEFFIDSFFQDSSGKGKALIGYRRPASPMQYSEAVLALCTFIEYRSLFHEKLVKRAENLLPLLADRLLMFIQKDGSVPCDKVIRWFNINSINWGNGAVLQALLRYYVLKYREV